MRLLLVRHAQTPSNVLGLLDSQTPGPGLSELGRAQAAAIPAAMAGRPVSSIAASTMVRTQQTAGALATDRGLAIRVDARLREIEAGDYEMHSSRDSVSAYLTVAWAWAVGELGPRMPGGQNGHEFFERFDAAVNDATALGGELPVVFSHAASIRVWAGNRCKNIPGSYAADNTLENTGSVLVNQLSSGLWELVSWDPDPLGGRHLGGKSGPEPIA